MAAAMRKRRKKTAVNESLCDNGSLLKFVDGSGAFDRRSDGVVCDARDQNPFDECFVVAGWKGRGIENR